MVSLMFPLNRVTRGNFPLPFSQNRDRNFRFTRLLLFNHKSISFFYTILSDFRSLTDVLTAMNCISPRLPGVLSTKHHLSALAENPT